MKKMLYICDRCSKEITDKVTRLYHNVTTLSSGEVKDYAFNLGTSSKDFCESCMLQIDRMIGDGIFDHDQGIIPGKRVAIDFQDQKRGIFTDDAPAPEPEGPRVLRLHRSGRRESERDARRPDRKHGEVPLPVRQEEQLPAGHSEGHRVPPARARGL